MEDRDYQLFEGECFLKTKTNKFAKYWAVVVGSELYLYKSKKDPLHSVMHSLAGTFIKEMPEEVNFDRIWSLWPVKIILPPCSFRTLYFSLKNI